MHPSPYRTYVQSQQKSITINPFVNSSMTSRSQSQSNTKQCKIKPLNELISMRENNHKILASKQAHLNNHLKYSTHYPMLTKQINLTSQPQQCSTVFAFRNKKNSNSNSKTKLHLSIKKSNQKYQTPLQTKNSSVDINTGLRKQKISLLSKMQTVKGSEIGVVKGIESKQQSDDNKENQEQNHIYNHNQVNHIGLKDQPNQGIAKLVLDKLNGNKDIFSHRTIKTTREIIQMKQQNKDKDKIKIKLQKKTKNCPFRV